MGWPHGRTKPKTGGRKKGTPNKRSQTLQDGLEMRLGQPLFDSIMDDILMLEDPAQRARLKIEIMPYVYPRRKALDMPSEVVPKDLDETRVSELLEWIARLDGVNSH